MVSTTPRSQGASVRVYCEDHTVQQGLFVWLTADGRKEVCIVCGSHMRLPFDQGYVWTDVVQCTAEFMHVVVALQSLSRGKRRVQF